MMRAIATDPSPSLTLPRTLTLPRALAAVASVAAVALLFSGAANWGWNTGRLPAPPIAAMGLVGAMAALVTLLGGARAVRWSMLAWSLASATLAMASFLWSSGSAQALQETESRVLSAILLGAFTLLFADEHTRDLARRLVVLSTLAAIAIDLYEVTHPLSFSMALGRSAGFYVNPNIAGAAIIAGMLIGLPVVPPVARELFVLACGVGVFTTLSRGALLCYTVTIVVLVLRRGVRGARLGAMTAGGAFVAASLMAALLASGRLGYLAGGAEQFVRQRLGLGSRAELQADVSASSRSTLALHALDMFGEKPLLGHGVAATIEWNHAESTHNVYVRHLAEYGLAGAALTPLLLLLLVRSARRAEGADDADRVRAASAWAFAIFVAAWGLFSHNVLDDPFLLVGIALVSADHARGAPA